MFFYLDISYAQDMRVNPTVLPAGEGLPQTAVAGTLYLRAGRQKLLRFDVGGGQLLFLGDPVFTASEKLLGSIISQAGKIREDDLFREVKGHYYWFYIHGKHFSCGSSFGAVYPVYYHRTESRIAICSSSFVLAEKAGLEERDRRNLLERLLFNYTFFNSTWWKEINLLEAHRYLHIADGDARVAGSFEISNYFTAPEDFSKGSLRDLSALFQEETQKFFPETTFGISLTGGFDGRTLVAAARKAGRDFFTYSFGRPDSTDVTLPAGQAARLKVPYFPICLDDQYVDRHSLESAWSFMELTEYNGNFGRPHYLYAARRLAEKTDVILTGNFGSELFRALHLPGVMMSEHLIRVFASRDNSWKDELNRYVRQLDADFFRNETEALIADIEQYIDKMKGWEANHKFYHFVFNEIFRKYFGPELVMQSNFLNNRTPYLNLHFFQQLNRTIWSGVHSRLFEKNKSKRMKGQMFYATFIHQADRDLFHLKTNKGYSPADVLESWRLPILAGRVVWHKYLNNKEIDDNSVHAFISKNHEAIEKAIGSDVPGSLKALFEKAIREIPEGQNIDRHIKHFSIAAGWKTAGMAQAEFHK